MAGTKEGGKKAAKTNLLKHGKDFYREIGRKGGQKGHTGGFYGNPEFASKWEQLVEGNLREVKLRNV